MIQSFRRLYECAFVNVRSNARMNILHYIVGYVHYFATATGFVSEAPGFVSEFDVHSKMRGVRWLHVELEWTRLTVGQWTLALVFGWAWWHQFTVGMVCRPAGSLYQIHA